MALSKYILLKKVSRCAYLFLFVIIFAHSTVAASFWDFNPNEQKAYQYIISLRPSLASPYLEPDRPASLYLQNLTASISLLINEDPDKYEKYETHFKDRLDYIDEQETNDPYKTFYLAELHLQHAFVNLKMGNQWTAAWDLRKTYKLIKSNIQKHPHFIPNYKSMGLLHVMVGSIPEKHQWFINLLGMQGSVTTGVEEIKRVAQSDNLFALEAKVISDMLDAYVLNKADRAVRNFKETVSDHPDNLLFAYLHISMLIKNSQGSAAIQQLKAAQQLQKKDHYENFNMLNYLAGEIYIQKGEYALSRNYYQAFIDHSKGQNLIKDAYYKIFLTYWLTGNEQQSLQAYEEAQVNGNTLVEADKHAERILEQKEFPNPVIMKVRLYTDGGFYDEAKALINSDPKFDYKKERVEFDYRKARLYHKQGDLDSAITYYAMVINATDDEPWYWAPNSCLQLGYIYHTKGDISLARYYFNEVLGYRNHEYKGSLDNKAKTALAAYE